MRRSLPFHPISSLLLLALLLLAPSCAHKPGVGEISPQRPVLAAVDREQEPAVEQQPDTDAMLEEAVSRSVDAYQRALEFYRVGDIEEAREWLDRSLSALLDVDPVLQ